MSTWQIFSDAGSEGFRWEDSGPFLRSVPEDDSTRNLSSSPPLPFMADLLLQGCSKLLEREEDGKWPMFTTGLGKSVALRESSIAKALSILGDDNAADLGCSEHLEGEEDGAGKLPMFRTGLGKSVALKKSSIAKALCILGDDNVAESASMHCAGAFLPRENGCGSSNSLFQTGSGKAVNISSAGLTRAKVMLGLEEDQSNGFNHVKKLSSSNRQHGPELSPLEMRRSMSNHGEVDAKSVLMHSLSFKTSLMGPTLENEVDMVRKQSEGFGSASKVPPLKFQTAGGKSLSVSTDALERARSLLGDPELGNLLDEDDRFFTPLKERSDGTPLNKENDICASFSHQGTTTSRHTSNTFVSPLQSFSKQMRSLVNSENLAFGSNLIKKFDAVGDERDSGLTSRPVIEEALYNKPLTSELIITNSSENVYGSRIKELQRSAGGPLTDITNRSGMPYANGEKRRLGRTASVSPFKRPRTSKFTTPLNKNSQRVPSGLSINSSEHSYSKRVLSTRYPIQVRRIYVKEYFGVPPSDHVRLRDQVRGIKSDNADKYVFADESGSKITGAEGFFQMLAESGASMQHASREWVTNHYKWIVWKLACYERSYPVKSAGKFLTISNVFEELKYRYEREVNHGHCSAIKRILAGDAPATSMMVLCISAIHSYCEGSIDTHSREIGSDDSNNAKLEITDGWYSMHAALDVLLTKQLTAGKLFVGQKLRIWGAGLCGWAGPTTPLEASSTVSLLLNMNGTYRAHWADRLGFCKEVGAPLAFSCIKSNGGTVPRTLAGITRIYPILYKERLSTGKSVVRSERMENKMIQLHNQRRSALVESYVSEYQREVNAFHNHNDSESEEGAKVFKLLETTAEPEVIMAEMSPEQLTSFATYKAKLEAARQTEMEKSISKALEDAGLGDRDVTPFMRLRVVGLNTISYQGNFRPKEGIVTIWNPTEKQKTELAEGQVYIIKGLIPMRSESGSLYLQARGSAAKWQPLFSNASRHFQPFFNPRKSVSLSNLGEVPLSSEFDIAAFVVYVGEVYMDVQQKKQWLFVTDGSIPQPQSGEIHNYLLAISFCSPYMDDALIPQINYNLAGSTVGFCNLIKRAKDQKNDLWVAEATENSIYFLNFDSPYGSHLKSSRDSAQSWANISSSVIDKLKEKVLFIISG